MEFQMIAVGWLLVGEVAAAEPVQVELLEDEVAQVIDLSSGRARVVPRSGLPPGTREGDVLVEGKLDEEATRAALQAVLKAKALAFPEER